MKSSPHRPSIELLFKRGLGSAEIARRLQISSSTVRNVVAAIKKRGDASEVKKSGRPRSVNTRNTRAIIKKRIIRNDGLSLNRMASQLGIARSTVQSIVKNDLKLKSYKLRRGQYLSDKSKAMRLEKCRKLLQHFQRGLGSAEIARRLQISSSTVRNVVAAIKKRGDASEVKKSGRPRSVNTRNTRAIIKKRIIRNDGLSLNRMASQLGIARSTVQSIVKNDLKLKSYKLRRGQYLSDKSKAMRLEKCRKLLQHFQVRRVSDVIWTDEKIFTIEPLPNRQNQRQLLSKDDSMSPKRRLAHNRLFPKSVMVWAGITATGKTPLVFIERNVKINSEVYQKIVLMDNLLPWVTQHFAGGPFILQQDWAPSHGSRSTLAVLEAHFPGFLDKNLWACFQPGSQSDGFQHGIRKTEQKKLRKTENGRRKTGSRQLLPKVIKYRKSCVSGASGAVYLERALTLKSSPFTNLERPDGSTTYNRPENRKLVLTHFSNLYAATTREPRSRYTHPDDPEILQHEVENAIVTSKTNISPGPDQITMLQLKLGNESIAPHLTAALNQVLTNGRTPEDWKTVKIYLLPKTTKPKKLKAYRPVALSSIVSKLFTKILTRRITAKSKYYLEESQAGFRRGRGCADSIQVVSQMLVKCTEFKIPLVAVFLGFTFAFDNVNWTKISEVLNNLQIGRNVIRALNNSNFSAIGELNVLNKKMKFKIKRGVRQGDSSSPLLFALALQAILDELDPAP
uniref:Reverse transcriptase domain-containing protein n=1 Tax=Caenorhabditis japonica TaxID=281687 RepID=A0A8R1EE70_CAEJA